MDPATAMEFSRALLLKVLLFIFLLTAIAFSQTDSSGHALTGREKLLVLPFEIHDLSKEEAILLTNRFADGLKESDRFEIVLKDSLQGLENSTDPRALAQAGSRIGANKVTHLKIVHRDKLYVLEIRLVNVSSAALLYAERVDYSGEFGSFLSDVIPDQARKLMQAHLDAKTPWAKAAFLFGGCLGAILWILWHFKRKDSIQVNSSVKA